jgi:hypothetical protein
MNDAEWIDPVTSPNWTHFCPDLIAGVLKTYVFRPQHFVPTIRQTAGEKTRRRNAALPIYQKEIPLLRPLADTSQALPFLQQTRSSSPVQSNLPAFILNPGGVRLLISPSGKSGQRR